ncbi:MAG: 3-deoxy-D-manno-octulosonic acid transferase [Deltaproteobacteria bacterium]|nr:3-deoxy-D-manno-octulosonic acid transferase [Deltaproteobacteria bacterium]
MTRLGYLFYNFVLIILCLCAFPFSLLKILLSKGDLHGERWGFYPQELLKKVEKRPYIWFHAASVGEVRVTLSVLGEMRKIYPHHGFLVSTTTAQGREIASQGPGVDAAILAPLDLPWIVRRTVQLIRPHAFLVTETELWPNLLREVKKARIPTILFNGRISRRSYRFYRPLRFLFQGVLRNFDVLCLRSSDDRERMMGLGADPQAIHVTGDLKFHQFFTVAGAEGEGLRQELRLAEGPPIFIAGSTHEGEEEMVLGVFKELKVDFPRLVLILAPRHLQRIPRVGGLLDSQGLRWLKRTMIDDKRQPEEVILLDTIGELAAIYGLGTVIFVGGSFCKVGGHNILEVFVHGKGVVFGPHMENFSEIAKLVLEKGAGIQVRTPEELKEVLKRLLDNPHLRQEMGERGLSLLQGHQGALERTMEIVGGLVKG